VDVVKRGKGELFTSPDPDVAREFFRAKNKALVAKVMTVQEAVRRFVHDGDYLAIGGFGANRIPTAVCHEIVRQKRRGMGFLGHTSTHDFQILAAGEVFDRCDVAYVVGLEARGLSPNARRYMESGKVRVTENSNYGLSLRLKAAAMGLPFLPARHLMGTDTFEKSPASIVTCPYTARKLVLQPAVYPDVAAIHVHEADVFGNCRSGGSTSPIWIWPGRAGGSLSPASASSTPTRSAATPPARSSPTTSWMPCARCGTAAIRGAWRTSTSPTRNT